MPETLSWTAVALGFAAGVALAALLAWWAQRGRATRERETLAQLAQAMAANAALSERIKPLEALVPERERLLAERDRAGSERERLAGERERLLGELAQARTHGAEFKARFEAAASQAEERLKLLQGAREQLGETFRALAADILEDKSKRFSEQNSQQLGTLLDPLKEQLKEFRERVTETWQKDNSERAVLKHEIDTLRNLNQQISLDAKNLALALKGDSRTQGAWGELVLERLLEASGLQKGREYETQQQLHDDAGGRPRPDVIVRLPEGRDLIVDAKVSLTAYERYCSAIDEHERGQQLSQHIASIKSHVRDLAERRYADLPGVNSLEFVLMFVPVEAAFIEAMRHDDGLYGYAMERQVVIVTTSTLLATLRTVASLWRFDDRNRNALEIAEKAGALYDKFAGFVADIERVENSIDGAQRAIVDAKAKLSGGKGNLVRRAEELKKLGAKAAKSLPPSLRERALDESAEAPGDDGPAAS